MDQSESRGFDDDQLPTGQQGLPLMSCFWCERLHSGEHPLSVCPACTARLRTMQSLEMSGSYPLSNEFIDAKLLRAAPGNYALGYMDGDSFIVFYVGRSDCDVRRRLHEWVDVPSRCESHSSSARAPWGTHRPGRVPLGAAASVRVENDESSYTHFAYRYARSAEEAYAREWRNYDAFGGARGLDNEAEPMSVVPSAMHLSVNAPCRTRATLPSASVPQWASS
jgi:hypothetical protein